MKGALPRRSEGKQTQDGHDTEKVCRRGGEQLQDSRECNDSAESSWLVRPPQGATAVSKNDGNQDRETNARQTETELHA